MHAASEKYVRAAAHGAGGLPILLPSVADCIEAAEMVSRLDGILVPGSRSNVAPEHYGGPPSAPETVHDPARDAMAMALLRAAVAADVPVLAICRGIQELNVALGGSLHQLLHEVPGRLDHRAQRGVTVDVRYAHTAHEVVFAPGGLLARIAGAPSLVVNSLHQQGVDRLAPGLVVEATAPDGQIEAVCLPTARFVVGVQWHPEFRFAEHAFSHALLRHFGDACRGRAADRQRAA